ncbi:MULTISPECIES: hypothetical protein [unclassified Frankia]|uniref:hypothetical protein n=1 Tax=unclassified Frankia TaxID=2632575 RepID=UPI002AD517FF|nr:MULTISPECIES: hypothetical protein [unclassified Frankia]
MTYAELHELVDRLTLEQAGAVRDVVRHLVSSVPAGEPAAEDQDGTVAEQPVRRLSFAGMLHSGRGDLAVRSEEIIRAELGRPT